MTKYIFILIFVLFLSACTQPQGKIHVKYVIDAHKEPYSNCVFMGKVFICTPATRNIPTKYYFNLVNCETENCAEYTVEVNKFIYAKFEIGDWYSSE